MGYPLSEFCQDVRLLLDEQAADESLLTNGGEGSGSPDVDDSELDALVKGYAVEGRNFVLRGCDASLLSEDLTQAVVPPSGVVALNDCLRLVRVQGALWKRSVSKFVDSSTPDYAMLGDDIAGGTIYDPKVGVRYGASGAVEITLSPSQPGGASYVSSNALRGEVLALENEVLRGALRHYVAGLVCQSLGDNRSEDFFEIALATMGVSGTTKVES